MEKSGDNKIGRIDQIALEAYRPFIDPDHRGIAFVSRGVRENSICCVCSRRFPPDEPFGDCQTRQFILKGKPACHPVVCDTCREVARIVADSSSPRT